MGTYRCKFYIELDGRQVQKVTSELEAKSLNEAEDLFDIQIPKIEEHFFHISYERVVVIKDIKRIK